MRLGDVQDPRTEPEKRDLVQRFLARFASWSLVVSASLGIIGVLADVQALLVEHVPARFVVACAATTFTTGIPLSLFIGGSLAALHVALEPFLRPRRHLAFTAVVFAGAVLFGTLRTYSFVPPLREGTNVAVVLFALAITLLAVLMRRPPGRGVRLVATAAGFGGLAVNAVLSRAYRDLQDLVLVVTITAGIVWLSPLRARFGALVPTHALAVIAAVSGLCLLETEAVDTLAPGWRVPSLQFSHFQLRYVRALRDILDLDRDGTAAIAWGADCDDFDRRRRPVAREGNGVVDANCNGIVPPAHPTDEDRGVYPLFGDPDLERGAIRRVVLVTIDAFRADIFRPEVVPFLASLASRSTVFTRAYAAGTSTDVSTRFFFQPTNDAPSVTSLLEREGVRTTALFGFTISHEGTRAFTRNVAANDDVERIPAPVLVDAALAELAGGGVAGPDGGPPRSLVWMHLGEAHDQRQPPPGEPPRDGRALGIRGDDMLNYARALHFIDRQLARFFEELERRGLLLGTAFVISADHGELFGEHGVYNHAITGYEGVVHVPLLVHVPGVTLPARHDGLVTHRDLPATIAGAFGLAREHPELETFGRSLWRLRDAPPDAALHRFVFVRTSRAVRLSEPLTPMGVVVSGRHKLIKTFEDGLEEIYDVVADPGELRELTGDPPPEVARLRHELELFRDIEAYP
jgi:hypothetical protein